MALKEARRLFNVDEYYRMADAGIFTEDDRVELIEGEIIEMSPIGDRHAACVDRLTQLLVRRVALRVTCQPAPAFGLRLSAFQL